MSELNQIVDNTADVTTEPTNTDDAIDTTVTEENPDQDFFDVFGDEDSAEDIPLFKDDKKEDEGLEDEDEDDVFSDDEPDDDTSHEGELGDNLDGTEGKKSSSDTIDVVYNGETKSVSIDEAKPLIQMGMNYGKIKEQNDQLNQLMDGVEPDAMNTLRNLAEMNGITVNDYVGQLNKFQNQAMIDKELQGLQKQYPNSSIDLLRKTATDNVNKRNQDRLANIKTTAQKDAEARQQRSIKMLNDFQAVYPDVNVKQLPSNVINRLKQGESLLSAYQQEVTIPQLNSKIESLEATIKANEKNSKNKSKSVGKLKSDEGKGDYTSEEEQFMSYFD